MVSFYPFNWIPRESVCKLIVFLLKGQDQKTCVGRKHGPRGSDSTLKCWALWLPKSDRVDSNGLWDSRRTNPLHSPLEDHMGTIPSELETNSSGAMSHYGGQGSLWGKKDDPGHRQLIPSQSCSGHLTFDSPKALRTEPGSKENQNLALQELILRKERKAWIQVTGNQDKELLKYIRKKKRSPLKLPSQCSSYHGFQEFNALLLANLLHQYLGIFKWLFLC